MAARCKILCNHAVIAYRSAYIQNTFNIKHVGVYNVRGNAYLNDNHDIRCFYANAACHHVMCRDYPEIHPRILPSSAVYTEKSTWLFGF